MDGQDWGYTVENVSEVEMGGAHSSKNDPAPGSAGLADPPPGRLTISNESLRAAGFRRCKSEACGSPCKRPLGFMKIGPATWVEKFPEARGARQSPVDIDTSRASSSGTAPPLAWRYSVNHPRSVVNPGYCWRVDENGYDSELRGGPLGSDVYKLQQWHCHWGAVNGEGSEHTVDGRAFSGELHLVHWNTSKYHSFTEAAGQTDGLAVLGVLLTVGSRHAELDKVVKLLPYIQHRGDKVTFSEPLNPAKLLPKQIAYWTYPGSLTTPPCTESVTWILFKEPIEVSAEQLALMRKLRCGEASCGVEAMELLHNYRPTLPLGNRELRDYGGN